MSTQYKQNNNKMTARNEMIRKIIDYIPNEKIKFCKNISGETELYFTNKKSMMTINKDNTWEELRRIIDSKLSKYNDTECEICLKSCLMKITRVSCCKCSKKWCVGCNIKMFIDNKGLSKCPYCRYVYGVVVPDNYVEMGVVEMLGRFEPIIQNMICEHIL